jgi:quinol monooxygenase YgiN
MTTSATPNKPIILINVFVVNPEDQWRLVDLLTRATEESVRHAPGFISSKLHRSLDGKKVAMYAHWRSMEAYQAMRESPAPGGYLEQALTIAKFDPGLYEVVGSFSSSREVT